MSMNEGSTKPNKSALDILAEAALFTQKKDEMTQQPQAQSQQQQQTTPTTVQAPNVAELLKQHNISADDLEKLVREQQAREEAERRAAEQQRAQILAQLQELKKQQQAAKVKKPTTLGLTTNQQPVMFVVANEGMVSPVVVKSEIQQQNLQLPMQQAVQQASPTSLQNQTALLLLQQQLHNTASPNSNVIRQQLTAALSTNSLGTNSTSSLSPMTGPNTANSSALQTPQTALFPQQVVTQLTTSNPDNISTQPQQQNNTTIPKIQLSHPTSTLRRSKHNASSGSLEPMDVVQEEDTEPPSTFGVQKLVTAVDEIDAKVDEHFKKALGTDNWREIKSNQERAYSHKFRNKPKRSTSFTYSASVTRPKAPLQRPKTLGTGSNGANALSLQNNGSAGGAMKISKTGPACVNYHTTQQQHHAAILGRMSTSTTPPSSSISLNQPVLSHLTSVPYIVLSKSKRMEQRNAQNNKKATASGQVAPSQKPLTDSELLQRSIARERLEREMKEQMEKLKVLQEQQNVQKLKEQQRIAQEAAIRHVALAEQALLNRNGGDEGNALAGRVGMSSDEVLALKAKLNSFNLLKQFLP